MRGRGAIEKRTGRAGVKDGAEGLLNEFAMHCEIGHEDGDRAGGACFESDPGPAGGEVKLGFEAIALGSRRRRGRKGGIALRRLPAEDGGSPASGGGPGLGNRELERRSVGLWTVVSASGKTKCPTEASSLRARRFDRSVGASAEIERRHCGWTRQDRLSGSPIRQANGRRDWPLRRPNLSGINRGVLPRLHDATGRVPAREKSKAGVSADVKRDCRHCSVSQLFRPRIAGRDQELWFRARQAVTNWRYATEARKRLGVTRVDSFCDQEDDPGEGEPFGNRPGEARRMRKLTLLSRRSRRAAETDKRGRRRQLRTNGRISNYTQEPGLRGLVSRCGPAGRHGGTGGDCEGLHGDQSQWLRRVGAATAGAR